MTTPGIMRSLGFDARDRVVVLHADDIGMCHATVAGLEELLDFGLVNSFSVMANCAWLPQVAAYCRAHTEVDAGVHLTLTCEWDSYRWRPLARRDSVSALLDEEGYMPRTAAALFARCDAASAYDEMLAQLRHVRRAGIHPTHLDTHMFTAWHPRLLPAYMRLASDASLPPLMLRLDEPSSGVNVGACGLDAAAVARSGQLVREWEQHSGIVFDRLAGLSLREPDERVERARQTLDALPAGLTHFLIHPAKDTPELRAVAPDWRARVADFEAFTSPQLRAHVKNSGIRLINYQTLQQAWHKMETARDALTTNVAEEARR